MSQILLSKSVVVLVLEQDMTGDNNCKDGINIMSTYLTGGKGALKWSKCTSQLLQNFLR